MTRATERPYDDVLPVCLMGESLLDRHNDLIATFARTVEIEDRERIVQAMNSFDAMREALAEARRWLVHDNMPQAKHATMYDLMSAIEAALAAAKGTTPC